MRECRSNVVHQPGQEHSRSVRAAHRLQPRIVRVRAALQISRHVVTLFAVDVRDLRRDNRRNRCYRTELASHHQITVRRNQ